jgi:hypothetical protein
MDCRTFRQQHLAYLDDTLSGDVTAEAQRHVLACDACAAHDTMVRRSLMMVRSLPTIAPSDDFTARLQARLAECKQETGGADEAYLDDFLDAPPDRRSLRVLRGSRVWLAMAAGVTVVGTVALRSSTGSATELELAPVLASAPAAPIVPTMVSPQLLQAMATGNPMWSMAVLVDDAPAHFLATSGELEFASYSP